MTDSNAQATQSALPSWRLSDALGAAIASPFLWTAYPDWGFPEPGESPTRDKLALAGWPEHECY